MKMHETCSMTFSGLGGTGVNEGTDNLSLRAWLLFAIKFILHHTLIFIVHKYKNEVDVPYRVSSCATWRVWKSPSQGKEASLQALWPARQERQCSSVASTQQPFAGSPHQHSLDCSHCSAPVY